MKQDKGRAGALVRVSVNEKIINKATDAEMKILNSEFKPELLDATGLITHIRAGHAWTPASLKRSDGNKYYRNVDSFDGAELLALDIDNSVLVGRGQKRRKEDDEGYLSFDKVKENSWVQDHCYLIYTTVSHTPEWHRFRIVFWLPTLYTDMQEYRNVLSAFIFRFDADRSCNDVVRVFYGNTHATGVLWGNQLRQKDVRYVLDFHEQQPREAKTYNKSAHEPTIEETREMLSYIPPQLEYIEWVKIISAVASKFDEQTAVQLIEEWSPGERDEVKYKFQRRMQKVTYGTLVWFAKHYGWLPKDEKDGEAERKKSYALSEVGNSERFVDTYAEEIKYEHRSNEWYIYNGKKFEKDERGKIFKLALRVLRELKKIGTEEERKYAFGCEKKDKLSSMLYLAARGTSISATFDEFDSNPWHLNLSNGIFNLRDWNLAEHTHEVILTRYIDIPYDDNAECPKWMEFLYTIMDGNSAMIDFLQRAVGYSIAGDTSEQCLFFAYGTGKNGKSVFFDTMKMILGDYFQKAPTDMLMMKRDGAIPNDIARLRGARFVVAAELPENKRFDESRIKDLTGGDRIVARYLHGEFFEFNPTHTLWVYGNHKPTITGTDDGIWRRIHMIPFAVKIDKDKQRPMTELMQEFYDERAGILRWMLEGCYLWQTSGLRLPAVVESSTEAYRSEMDALAVFCDEHLERVEGKSVTAKQVYERYVKWSQETNEYTMKSRALYRKLRERGYADGVDPHLGVVVFMHLQLREGVQQGTNPF
jgi:putative DNA primase/helicase